MAQITAAPEDADRALAPAPRPERIEALLEELRDGEGRASAGRYNALAVLLSEAMLAADQDALAAGHDGLQQVHAAQLALEEPGAEEFEQRGRVLATLDLVAWSLRRLTPADVGARLETGGHARRFLQAIAADPGLSNGELAARLGTDETEISRVGRRLLEAGLARKQRTGRRNEWEITPRGRTALGERAQPVS